MFSNSSHFSYKNKKQNKNKNKNKNKKKKEEFSKIFIIFGSTHSAQYQLFNQNKQTRIQIQQQPIKSQLPEFEPFMHPTPRKAQKIYTIQQTIIFERIWFNLSQQFIAQSRVFLSFNIDSIEELTLFN